VSVWWSQALACSLAGAFAVTVLLCMLTPLTPVLNAAVMLCALPAAWLIVSVRAYLRGPLPPDDPLLADWYASVSSSHLR
jgi:hypothetical protein